ncbi:lipolytic protein-like protein G-D-S-L family [Pseudovirgaria hyperparasitica]|uniref:Lipolytic protein-like protein G-D-S-L family n=1 Tax=Pseudovirgaria hyperparasitica TaxID=470096 RepID=A0A6A6WA65_9PEZI|nr:lipolytic protein-like protein G-D-S-L family [Pseudovirgaria hyperparasitica]KAF2758850.1 lipolytic protein-like protein G-D-S-L family [Pseudovirgaria hyperparasitica]
MLSFTSILSSLLAASSVVTARPRDSLQARALPPYWLLAGDSTTAPKGGWGDGFLSTTLSNGAAGKNYGHSGATTASFRAGGDWANVLSSIKSQKASYQVYVTIQFGHNDQKSTSGVTLDQFQTNLETFVKEVVSAGATPILVTSLTRRTFTSATPPAVIEDLANVVNRTKIAASNTGARWIDLNKASTAYVNALGPDAAHAYNLNATDNTHLNAHGGVVFARLVSDLLVAKYPEFAAYTLKNETLSTLIKQGKPA